MAKEVFNNLYYDIEALRDIFSLVTFNEVTGILDVYYLIDTSILGNKDFTDFQKQLVSNEIYAKNKNFTGEIRYHNLYNESENVALAKVFGCSAPGYMSDKFNFPLISDVDAKYDPDACPYLMGYNSLNYDQTILSMYFAEIFANRGNFDLAGNSYGDKQLLISGVYQPTTPAQIRVYNDELFHPMFKGNMPERLKCVYIDTNDQFALKNFNVHNINGLYLKNEDWNTTNPAFYIRRNQINSGRHIDVARLNEKQTKVGLKRLLGMMGYQILEADTDLSGKSDDPNVHMSFEDIMSLLAYNVSDVVNLKNLFHDKNYVATFKIKKQLLTDYPELIYEKRYDSYKPDIRPDKIKRNRHTINSSSAQLAASCLCPYGNLIDDDVVSFMYPSEVKAKELGIPQMNVLDETEKFIETRLKPLVKDAEGQQIIDKLNEMVANYRNIEGKDFNATHDEIGNDIYNFKSMSKTVNVPYMGPDGRPAGCYVTFSVGGLHGAEYNKELYDADVAAFEAEMELFNKVVAEWGSASNLLLTTDAKGKAKKRKTIEIDGVEYEVARFIPSSETLKNAQAGLTKFKSFYENPQRPKLFVKKQKKEGVHKKYVKTSFGMSNHEDFTSYYPSMLINMSAFWNNGLGYDRYAEIFGNKEKFGKMMKDPKYTEEEREIYSVMRNGTKLILNSASGAADTDYKTPIRMNNRIIAMRIIGQLFTWRIGQAQSLEGADVISTNTDGLYTVFDEEENAKILEREAEIIHVGIEPEPLFLVSKDANNRWEGTLKGKTGNALVDVEIDAASGASLACRMGPRTDKALAHPAIQDWALSEFLKWKALSGAINNYNPDIGKYLLDTVAPATFIIRKDKKPVLDENGYTIPDRVWLLRMFQNVIASNPSNGTYNFATKEPITSANANTIEPIFMQHYSRVFYVNPEKVPAPYKDQIVYLAQTQVRSEEADASLLAIKVIKDLNGNSEVLAQGTPKVKKIPGIEYTIPCLICNEDLNFTTSIELDWLDYDYYNALIASTYKSNWQNDVDEDEREDSEDEDDDV